VRVDGELGTGAGEHGPRLARCGMDCEDFLKCR
jgi:hypothetical protein